MQREGALQSLCQLVKEVLTLEIAETYHIAMNFLAGLSASCAILAGSSFLTII
jgi:hypothetical protein